MEEARYRMHLYWYKQKIWQCKILLPNTGSIQNLKAIPPSLTSFVESVASPTQCSDQVPSQGTRETGQPSTAERNAAQTDALAAVQQITQPPPPNITCQLGIYFLIDSNEVSVAGAQGGSSSKVAKKNQAGNIKPVPRNVSNCIQELRTMLSSQVGVMIYLSHMSYHFLNIMVINPSLG